MVDAAIAPSSTSVQRYARQSRASWPRMKNKRHAIARLRAAMPGAPLINTPKQGAQAAKEDQHRKVEDAECAVRAHDKCVNRNAV